MPQLQTDRLTIAPFTRDLMLAALQDPAETGAALGLQIAAGWPNPDELEVLPILAGDLERDPDLADWGMQLVIHNGDRTIIGCVGLMGRPTPDGTVEVGYGIAPPYQGHGYATEATRALIDWALAQPPIRRVIASCLKENRRSIRVIEKAGFRPLAPTEKYLNWEIRKEDWRAARRP
jgi:ribosomal-protein-alanine N-acetyltransferase